jgi:Flagellar assembly protein T, C-terminal domain
MRGKAVILALALTFAAASLQAQDKTRNPIPSDMYCSGLVTRQAPPQDTVLITGEGSDYKLTFQENDYVYINKGEGQGVHVGDEFSIIRPVSEPTRAPWFNQEFSIMRAMGTLWEDEGRVKVVVVQPNTSIAQVENSCEYLQRGDVALPFAQRPAPPLKSEDKFDRFAPASGKPKAMVVTGKHFQQTFGSDDVVYVNLGAAQGVKVGDYFRVYRQTGNQNEFAYQTRRMAFDVYGFGAVSKEFKPDNTPREVLGEGIVVRTSENASSVILTFALREIYAGDYVELE